MTDSVPLLSFISAFFTLFPLLLDCYGIEVIYRWAMPAAFQQRRGGSERLLPPH